LEPKAKGPFRIIGSEAIQAERQKQLLCWRTLYGQPPSKDEPLFDEGVYAGPIQFFLSDARRDA
jgi:hypothetical protein